MSIFALADLHLSGEPPQKPMDRFSPAWENHWDKIRAAWLAAINEHDTVLIAGDTSWAMKWHDAAVDLEAIAALPGQKILVRGNHDYWWSTVGKMNQAMARVTDQNLDLALTQKKSLKALSREYDQLTQEVSCLPPLDAAQVLEEEYNYILTIGNIIETTRELKKNVAIGEENRTAIIDGLLKFYDGLRQELASTQTANVNQA